jgi:hypothetical protein
MEAVPVELDPDLIDLLEELGRPAKEAARELIALGLYGRGELSSGRWRIRSPAHLYLRGRDFVLRDLSPSDLQALGIDVRRPEYATTEEQVAFIGYGEQNREGGLECRFSGEKLRAFYGRCHLSGRCVISSCRGRLVTVFGDRCQRSTCHRCSTRPCR